MSIVSKIKTEQVVVHISQELNSDKLDDLKDLKKEASEVKKELSESKNYNEHVYNTTEEESLKAIDDLEKPMEHKIEPPYEEDIIGAIENYVKSKPKKNEDDVEAIEQLHQSEIKPKITKKLYCQNELDRHLITRQEGPYSCTFCDFNTMRKENLSLHLKTNAKVDSITKYAANVKKATSITRSIASAKYAANVKKASSITRSIVSAKNATIVKSKAKVATITKSIDKVATITNVTSKVVLSSKQPKKNALKTVTPNIEIERKIPKNEEEKSKAVKPAHLCAPCNLKSERKQKLYQHMQTEKHARTIKDKDKNSNLPNKRKADDEAANQNNAKSLKSNALKIVQKQCSKNPKEKASTTKSQINDRVHFAPVYPMVPRNFYSTKAPNQNSKVSKSSSNNLKNKQNHEYSVVSIASVVAKLSNTASKKHWEPVVTKLPNNKIKQTKLPKKITKQQTLVPVVIKLINKTASKRPFVEVVNKLPNKTQKRPAVVTKLQSKTRNQQSSKKQTPQKILEVQRLSAKIQNLRNMLKSQASEGGTNTESLKITQLPKKGSLLSSTEEPKNKMAKHNIEIKDDNDDTADYTPAKKIYSDVNNVKEENIDPNGDESPKNVMISNSSQHLTNGHWIDSVECRNDLYRNYGPIVEEGWKLCFEDQKLDGKIVKVAKYMNPNGEVITRGSNGYDIPELMTNI